jgi:hypothetical protein
MSQQCNHMCHGLHWDPQRAYVWHPTHDDDGHPAIGWAGSSQLDEWVPARTDPLGQESA